MSGLKRLARDTLTNLTPHPFYVFLHYSHPPMQQRLAALNTR
jgi:STE24 endopeptidase